MDNRILFLQKCLLNSFPHFIRLLSELLNLIGYLGNSQVSVYRTIGPTLVLINFSNSGSLLYSKVHNTSRRNKVHI